MQQPGWNALAGLAASILLLGSSVGAAAPRPAAAEPLQFAGGTALSVVQRGAISLQEAIAMATRDRPGRVVRAVTVERGGRQVHEIRILLDEGGRVVTVTIDAEGGGGRR